MRRVALVVDDEVVVRRVVTQALSQRGFYVFEAEDGELASLIVRWRRPEVVVVDNEMPNMSGIDFVKSLRETPWGANAIVVMFSVSDANDVRKHVDVVVSKREGIRKLRQVLDQIGGQQ